MTDAQARELLRLLALYVTEYESCADMRLSEMASDLAISMDATTDEDDANRRLVETYVTPA